MTIVIIKVKEFGVLIDILKLTIDKNIRIIQIIAAYAVSLIVMMSMTEENKCARKRDLSVDEVRNIIIDCFDGFPEYMMMKLQSTEVEDEERIKESINKLKDYMLKKINE